MRKIDAPRRWILNGFCYANVRMGADPVRIVDERDYRALLAVARATETWAKRPDARAADRVLLRAVARLNRK